MVIILGISKLFITEVIYSIIYMFVMSSEERPLYYIPAPQFEKINQICNDIDRYPSFREFLADALEVFITWWAKPEKIQDSIQKMWPDLTDAMKENIKTNARPFYEAMEDANKQNSGVTSQSSGLVFKYKNSSSLEEKPLYYIPAPQFEKINQICNDIDRYPTWHDFMQETVEIFITWWTEPWMTQHMIQKLWPDVTDEMKENTKINAPAFYKAMEDANKQSPDLMQQSKLSSQKTMQVSPKTGTIQPKPSDEPLINQQRDQQRTMKNDLKETHDYISKLFEQNQLKKPSTFLKYDGYPLIWSFYSRFFPIKLALSVLAHIIYQDKEQSISLEMFSKRAYDVAIAYSEELRFYELERKIPRNKKVSTGLPSPPLATKSRTDEEILKFVASKDRFIQHFIGKKRKKKDEEFFDGALNAMGLVHVSDGENPKVSLSRKGAEFYLLSNPTIHDKIRTRTISEQEKDFILEHIIPGFELENKLVDVVRKKIVQKSKEKKLEDQFVYTTDLDSLFNTEILDWIKNNEEKAADHYIDWIKDIASDDKKKKNVASKLRTSFRIATMGRLAEIGAVEWSINKKGKSSFKLPENSIKEQMVSA